MKSSLLKIETILRRLVDSSALVYDASAEFDLSPFLSGSFNLYKADVLGDNIFFAESVAGIELESKRLDALVSAIHSPVVVFLPYASSSEKRAIIAKRQGFITESGDMYLPQLALALKGETTRKVLSTATFTPSQQQAFLYCLLSDVPLTQEGLRKLTGMSAPSASRAFSSLVDAGLIDYEIGGKTGRKLSYFVPDAVELYQRGKKLFGNPVKSVEKMACSHMDELLDSGLSALARRSELVAPRNQIVAIGPDIDISDSIEEVKETEDNKICTIQKLAYNPLPFSQGGMVDPFTMIMTIDDEDERISIALREALKECQWYTD